jgi:PKD repeat protein
MKNTTTFLFLGLIVVLLLTTCSLDKIDDLKSGNGCPNAPVANFTPDKANCAAPCTVTFTNASTGATIYAWDFGAGGGTSTDAAPSHTFTTAGTYSVRLIATGAGGCKDTAKTDIIIVTPGAVPVAAFTITNGGCTGPCDVVFTNNSTDATAFEWDFGDGTPKVTQGNPTHRYELVGDYIVKLTATGPGGSDSETKTVLIKARTFIKTIGGANNEAGYWVEQTPDGGYIVSGEAFNNIDANSDVYLLKIKPDGGTLWEQKIDYGYDESAKCITRTTDGGFLTAGTISWSPDAVIDMHIVKTLQNGAKDWTKNFGEGSSNEQLFAVVEATDGNYVFLGYDLDGSMYLFKMNKTTHLPEWENHFSATNQLSFGFGLEKTTDGGFILTGTTYESSGQFDDDIWCVKTDESGTKVWQYALNINNGNERSFSIQQTTDDGYILTGYTDGEGAGLTDLLLVKINNAGQFLWKKTFGGLLADEGHSVRQTMDGGYIIAGSSKSFGAGDSDLYLVKTDAQGVEQWHKTYGSQGEDTGSCVRQTTDGGYIVVGTLNGADIYLIKTDKDGNAQ